MSAGHYNREGVFMRKILVCLFISVFAFAFFACEPSPSANVMSTLGGTTSTTKTDKDKDKDSDGGKTTTITVGGSDTTKGSDDSEPEMNPETDRVVDLGGLKGGDTGTIIFGDK
jgi:hypothetical protein